MLNFKTPSPLPWKTWNFNKKCLSIKKYKPLDIDFSFLIFNPENSEIAKW